MAYSSMLYRGNNNYLYSQVRYDKTEITFFYVVAKFINLKFDWTQTIIFTLFNFIMRKRIFFYLGANTYLCAITASHTFKYIFKTKTGLNFKQTAR